MDLPERRGRRVVAHQTAMFGDYDLDGIDQPEISLLTISYDRATEQGSYFMRMQPGAVTVAHEHPGMEEFLILEGELIDDDGAVFKAGDFVSYEAGTHHNSRTVTGCLILVLEWRRPAPAQGLK